MVSIKRFRSYRSLNLSGVIKWNMLNFMSIVYVRLVISYQTEIKGPLKEMTMHLGQIKKNMWFRLKAEKNRVGR